MKYFGNWSLNLAFSNRPIECLSGVKGGIQRPFGYANGDNSENGRRGVELTITRKADLRFETTERNDFNCNETKNDFGRNDLFYHSQGSTD